eukprot:CAMPEP_0181027266 /NCGR_PEP_ID=MMETSP1070-20121207/4075_1 /TAXON_ID=265543 /ORGANISM="Minutocellus polymorphus, Strain NH13" /LENGTH=403 /DNA_ID=CAMNT_0023104501 /DNA_START=20 /DNA_END=1231 /DNA_ORIENTATION=+
MAARTARRFASALLHLALPWGAGAHSDSPSIDNVPFVADMSDPRVQHIHSLPAGSLPYVQFDHWNWRVTNTTATRAVLHALLPWAEPSPTGVREVQAENTQWVHTFLRPLVGRDQMSGRYADLVGGGGMTWTLHLEDQENPGTDELWEQTRRGHAERQARWQRGDLDQLEMHTAIRLLDEFITRELLRVLHEQDFPDWLKSHYPYSNGTVNWLGPFKRTACQYQLYVPMPDGQTLELDIADYEQKYMLPGYRKPLYWPIFKQLMRKNWNLTWEDITVQAADAEAVALSGDPVLNSIQCSGTSWCTMPINTRDAPAPDAFVRAEDISRHPLSESEVCSNGHGSNPWWKEWPFVFGVTFGGTVVLMLAIFWATTRAPCCTRCPCHKSKHTTPEGQEEEDHLAIAH